GFPLPSTTPGRMCRRFGFAANVAVCKARPAH
ncbi:hypothetical protein C5167_036926, partial [Papaver somniferum]